MLTLKDLDIARKLIFLYADVLTYLFICIDLCVYTHVYITIGSITIDVQSSVYAMVFICVYTHIHMCLSSPSLTGIHHYLHSATSMDKESFAYLGRFRLGGHFNHVQGYYGTKGSGGNKVADGDNGGYFWG